MWPKRQRQSTAVSIIALAVFDSMFMGVVFFNMSVTWVSKFYSPENTWLSRIYPYTWIYIQPIARVGHYASTWTVMLITFHRYVTVCHPTKVKIWCSVRNTLIQLVIIFVVFVIFNIPRALFAYVEIPADGTTFKVIKSSLGQQRFWYDTFYESILYFTVIYVIPFPALITMTYKLIRSLKHLKQKRRQMGGQLNAQFREERDLTRTMIVVVLVYLVSQTPNPIRRALLGLLPASQTTCGKIYYYYHPVSTCILITNSAVNFLIYYMFGKRFRLTFHARIRKLLRLSPKIGPAEVSSREGSLPTTKSSKTVTELIDMK